MKILNVAQIKAVEKATMQNQKISSLDLMEKAATRCFQWIENQNFTDDDNRIHIFCGLGNNGGDGLAIGRMLSLEFYNVHIYIIHYSDKMSEDFISNYNKAEEFQIYPTNIYSEEDFPEIDKKDIVIDALFGTGLNKKPEGLALNLIQYLNNNPSIRISIDVPSGLFIDKPVFDKNAVFKSHYVVTFQAPKLAFLLPENQEFVESFIVLDIGLDQEYINKQETSYYFTESNDIIGFYKKRSKFSHKGDFGHTLIIGGSYGKMGSVVLATKSAMKMGSGLVTAYIPKSGYQILQTSVPEAMVEVDDENLIRFFNYKTQATVIGLGIGLGTDETTSKGLISFLENNKLPIVIDADALNIIAENKKALHFLNENTILTPHPKELKGLIGDWKNDYEKLEMIRDFTIKYPSVLVVKGAHTMVVQNGNFYFNSSGNPALAKAGSGDVLTGMIAGLLAQTYKPIEAAILGVYLHGVTSDLYVILSPVETFTATEIINYIPSSLITLVRPMDMSIEEEDEFTNFDENDFSDDDF
jgi:hydroxyethylthiazole kinase-like uncharacterized protein yjeF